MASDHAHSDRRPGAPPPEDEQPLGADAEFFETGRSDRSTVEQRERYDEFGNDIRMFTGEPVETEHDGVVIPQQMNVGADNMAGSGEFPDGERPPARPSPEEGDR